MEADGLRWIELGLSWLAAGVCIVEQGCNADAGYNARLERGERVGRAIRLGVQHHRL